MLGDKHHAILLKEDWKWDGESYTRTFGLDKMLHLRPDRIEANLKITRNLSSWSLWIFDKEGEWIKISSYNYFVEAANAILGNRNRFK
jgi:hypothetical protein